MVDFGQIFEVFWPGKFFFKSGSVALLKQLIGLPALNLLDRRTYPELTELLKRALNL